MKNQYNRLFAHLVPTGTPGALIPVIVIIETVSNIIRPLTLSIRLAANIVAGHLLLTLLGSQISNISFTLDVSHHFFSGAILVTFTSPSWFPDIRLVDFML